MKEHCQDWETESIVHLLKLRKCIIKTLSELKSRVNEIEKWLETVDRKLKEKQSEFINLKELKKQQTKKSNLSLNQHSKLQTKKQKRFITAPGIKKRGIGDVIVGIMPTEVVPTKKDGVTVHMSSQFSTDSPLKSLKKRYREKK